MTDAVSSQRSDTGPKEASELEPFGGWSGLIGTVMNGEDLTGDQSGAALREILRGAATDAQIAAFIVALRMKGETIAEVTGLVGAMMESAAPIELPIGPDPIDIVGTGGAPTRRLHALNVSTMASFVAAGAGARVVKHGNRKASSTSGSFDLLEALGVAVELDGAGVARCVAEAGIGFCFARSFHPAMRHVGPVRTQLGVPTVFNYLGPLSHPAGVLRQVIGVSDPRLAATVVGVLAQRGSPRAMVVTGSDGMDELTTTGPSTLHELRDGSVSSRQFDPGEVGIAVVAPSAIAGGDAAANARIAERVFGAESGAHRDIVCLNAAAGLVVGGVVDDLATGVAAAQRSIDSGAARRVLDRLVEVCAELR
ncbi:MAG: anthranilate phosphoribosyltransferase [Actinobacteria bacterium]|uniref:anthranilate phosphoribosyltransferase n=1 Tax=freshwater metagenome TaxID=449393 RepID=A0A6J5YK05_9ZZZZ|nr:anthranilate phosphoribosyltransferase [Actinomycetota bacterium]MTA78315.1 anthranilate phosphoribosyltransferase [Actinomycetota bacterium]